MKSSSLLAFTVVCAVILYAPAMAQTACPVTGALHSQELPFPESPNWYGTPRLAVQLPDDGVWATTNPGALIAVKLFWWSTNFELGYEPYLNVSVRELSGLANTAEISRTTNAIMGKDVVMLTGIDFPDPGCWEITGEYVSEVLTFVVEVIPVDDNRRLISARQAEVK